MMQHTADPVLDGRVILHPASIEVAAWESADAWMHAVLLREQGDGAADVRVIVATPCCQTLEKPTFPSRPALPPSYLAKVNRHKASGSGACPASSMTTWRISGAVF